MTLAVVWNLMMLVTNIVLVVCAGYYAYQGDYAHASFCLLLGMADKRCEPQDRPETTV